MDLEVATCYLCGGAIGNIDDVDAMYEEDLLCGSCEHDVAESIFEDDLMEDGMTEQEDD